MRQHNHSLIWAAIINLRERVKKVLFANGRGGGKVSICAWITVSMFTEVIIPLVIKSFSLFSLRVANDCGRFLRELFFRAILNYRLSGSDSMR